MIIDFHTHCFPDALAPRAIATLAASCDCPAHTDGTIAALDASMRKNGIDRSVMLQIATKPSQNHTVNSWAIEQLAQPRIIPFGSVHPRGDDWAYQLDRLAEAGVKGIKFHPEYQDFYVDDETVFPVYAHAARLGLVVVFHAGVDIGFPPPVHCTPERVKNILRVLPEERIVLAHMGGWKMWDDVDAVLRDTRIYYDTSFCHAYLAPEKMTRLIENHGTDKILFASDSPWEDQADALDTVRRLPLDSATKRAILGDNATRLLRMT